MANEKFYTLRVPFHLFGWFTDFDRTSRSHLLRCFICNILEMMATQRGRDKILKWSNGQGKLTLEPPLFFKGMPVPRLDDHHGEDL